MSSDMYTDTPTIASDPIYVGPPTNLTLEEGTGAVRVWSDEDGAWIDDHWRRNGDRLQILGAVRGTVRVVEMVPVSERNGSDFSGYEEKVDGVV